MRLTELIVGDVLVNFAKEAPVPGGGTIENPFCTVSWEDKNIDVLRVTERPGFLGIGTVRRKERIPLAFRWLPYVDGRINWTPAQGRDVLSGRFTGCIMSRYSEEGALRVAHVVTSGDVDSDCKAQWKKHKDEGRAMGVLQFKPHKHVDDVPGERTFGVFTSDGRRFALSVRLYNPLIKNPWKHKGDWLPYLNSLPRMNGQTDQDILDLARALKRSPTAQFEKVHGQSFEIRAKVEVPNDDGDDA